MTVAEKEKGTMLEAKGTKTPEVEGKTPVSEKVSSEQAQKLYTQAELDAMLHAAKSEAGRKAKEIEQERDTLKSQLSAKEQEIEDIQSERDSVRQQIEELTADDPKKFDLIKRDKELRDEQRQLRAEKQALEAEKQAHAETIRIASETMREITIWDVASEYEGGDAVRLKALADTVEATTEEKIREVANILWKPKGETERKEPEKETLKPYSGYTEGGAKDTSGLSATQKIALGLKEGSKYVTKTNE